MNEAMEIGEKGLGVARTWEEKMEGLVGVGEGEAKKELRGMVIDEGIPESVWVSAVEAYFHAVGTAGAETAKGVFLGLLRKGCQGECWCGREGGA
ncbi:hypothetical protein RIF29_16872 [Crotalaria pallida]|uniref:Uncharacterized protein n=1 Tax=Crotalaria pallida TaxID=3830 RepID=A0AAN9FHA6_CROPI